MMEEKKNTSNTMKDDTESSSKCEWSQQAVMKLIALWSSNDCLYNTKNLFYKNKHCRQEVLTQITESLKEFIPGLTIHDVKVKITNLRSQYTRELAKMRSSTRSGVGTDDLHEPTAYWFTEMQFLKDFITTRKGKSNIDDSELITLEDTDESQAQFYTQDSLSSIIEGPGIPPPPPKKRRATESEDSMLNQAASALESIATILNAEKENRLDDVHMYGEHIKAELYTLNPREREELKFKISSVIHEFKLARM